MEPLIRMNAIAATLVIVTVIAASMLEWGATFRTRLAEIPVGHARWDGRLRAAMTAFAEVNLLRTRERGERDRNTKQVLVVAIVGSLALGWLVANRVPALRMPGSAWVPLAIGLALMWAGIFLRVWGVATLGRFFRRVVVIQTNHRVVTNGPYRYIRHPAYAGTLLTYLGFGVAMGNWLSALVCLIIPFLGHLPRIATEEAALTAQLGEEYRAYTKRTARLIPKIW